jgi:uncharacterized membrane protein YwzB
MEGLILAVFIFILISLNVVFFTLFKKGKLNPMISGILMMLLAPVIGFTSGSFFLHFYDWSSGGTGEGAGFGGAFLGLITLANGVLIFVFGVIRWLLRIVKKSQLK